jgi:hypothetical protein
MNGERKIGKICRRSGKIYLHSWKKKPEPEMPTLLPTRHADAAKPPIDAGIDRHGMALIGADRASDDNRHCGTENASLLNRLQLITKDQGPC